MLVPQVAAGASRELASLRGACGDAIRRLAARPRRLVLLGGGAVSRRHGSLGLATLTEYAPTSHAHLGPERCEGACALPLSLTIGAWLVEHALGPELDVVAFSAGPDFATSESAGELRSLAQFADVAVLVMGDGSACRSTTAPGYLDPRAVPFDDAVLAALRRGDAAYLASLDLTLGQAVLAAGVPAWRAAGSLLADGTFDAELLYADDPYGVAYFVAAWTARG